ncbi:hypothetical protein PITCH_A140044 [uncultured Desulfobacterium sp.]|uniref:Uncharacterized protein n=1 Tax=uncultured Desulfobacterium sp. TaxID=201089 RepID=A0A445MSQ7_9BACT|nr:hypothetical protein PITCH_A140044 [uncultured Desulfobacterium sp.]
MIIGSLKIFFGFAFLLSAFKTDTSLPSVAFGLIGLYLMAVGLVRFLDVFMNFMAHLGSLSKTGSNPSHPQNPA